MVAAPPPDGKNYLFFNPPLNRPQFSSKMFYHTKITFQGIQVLRSKPLCH